MIYLSEFQNNESRNDTYGKELLNPSRFLPTADCNGGDELINVLRFRTSGKTDEDATSPAALIASGRISNTFRIRVYSYIKKAHHHHPNSDNY